MMDDLSLATHQGRSVFDDADLDKCDQGLLQAEQYMIEGFNKTANVGYAHGEGEKWLDRWNENKPRAAIRWQRTRKKAAAYALENPRLVSIIGPAGTGKRP